MRIPNLMHGSFFMLGAYFGVTFLDRGVNFWLAALLSAAAMAVIGGADRALPAAPARGPGARRRCCSRSGFSFIIADLCLMVWTGDPWQPATPSDLQGAVQVSGLFFPIFRLVDRRGRGGDRDRAVAAWSTGPGSAP